MTFTALSNGSVWADMEYRSNQGTGRTIFLSQNPLGAGGAEFSGVFHDTRHVWGGGPRSGRPWMARRMRLSLNSASGELVFDTPACGHGVLTRNSPVAGHSGSRPRTSMSMRASGSSLESQWTGRLRCRGSVETVRDVTLTIHGPSAGRLLAKLAAYHSSSASGRMTSDRYLGELESGADTYLFVRTGRNLHGVEGANARTFRFGPTGREKSTLTLEDSNCDPVEMVPVSPLALASKPLATPPGKGTFSSAVTSRAQCETLIDWAMHLKAERDRAADYSHLYTDLVFIPVFGRPYDTMSEQDLKHHYQGTMRYGRRCTRDPHVRARFSGAERAYRHGFVRNAQTRGYIRHVVQRNRSAEHTISRIQRDYAQTPDVSANRYVEQMKRLLDDNRKMLLPKRLAAFEQWQHDKELEIMDRLVAAAVARIEAAEGPREALRISKSVVVANRHGPKLRVDKRDALLRRARTSHRDAAEALLGPRIAKIARIPPWKPTLEHIADTERYLGALQADLLEKTYQNFSARLHSDKQMVLGAMFDAYLGGIVIAGQALAAADATAEKQRTFGERFAQYRDQPAFSERSQRLREQYAMHLDQEIAQRVPQLASLAGSLAALRASVKWRDKLERELTAHARTPSVFKARETYQRQRARLLEEAVEEFAGALSKTSASDHSALMLRYLSQPQDRHFPVSIEYRLVTKLFRADQTGDRRNVVDGTQ